MYNGWNFFLNIGGDDVLDNIFLKKILRYFKKSFI
jgi:hypothetical protein